MNWKIGKKTDMACIPCKKKTRTVSFTRALSTFGQTYAKAIHNSIVPVADEHAETLAHEVEAEQKRAMGITYSYRTLFK
jgi:hypothetical protein